MATAVDDALRAEAEQLHDLLAVTMEPFGNEPPSVEGLMLLIAAKRPQTNRTVVEEPAVDDREAVFNAEIDALRAEHGLTDEEVEELRDAYLEG